jgi:hypothetical protein
VIASSDWHDVCIQRSIENDEPASNRTDRNCSLLVVFMHTRSLSHDWGRSLPAEARGRVSCNQAASCLRYRPLLPGSSNLGGGRGPRDSLLPGRTGGDVTRLYPEVAQPDPIISVRPTLPQARRSIPVGLRAFCFQWRGGGAITAGCWHRYLFNHLDCGKPKRKKLRRCRYSA